VKQKVFGGIDFCLLDERARMLNEVFSVIQSKYYSSCSEFVKRANNSAPAVKLHLYPKYLSYN
jgi:hypothetical protein